MNIDAYLRGILGICLLTGIAFLFSNNRKKINWRLVGSGLLLQIFFGILIIKGDDLQALWYPLGYPKMAFMFFSSVFVKLLSFTSEGANFIFGNLSIPPGFQNSLGFYFAFQVLPTIIFFSALMSVLYYLGIMQKVVGAMAWIMARIMGTSGAESLSNTANIFIGQTEAPLMIRPFIKDLTESELLTIMVGGMATIAGGVMAAYVQMLGQAYAQAHGIGMEAGQIKFAAQLMGGSIMAAPAGLLISKILFPETGSPVTQGKVKVPTEKNASNVIEAAASGASDGMMLSLNIAAMLLAFIALIALSNYLLTSLGDVTGWNAYFLSTFGQPLSMQLLFGLIFQFIAYGIGVPWNEAFQFGTLLGTKVVLNEFVAYLDMSKMMGAHQLVSEKSIMMATYALCGFANFSSIAIQIGGIGSLAPNRKKDISKLGLLAVLGGMLATLLTATIGGILAG